MLPYTAAPWILWDMLKFHHSFWGARRKIGEQLCSTSFYWLWYLEMGYIHCR